MKAMKKVFGAALAVGLLVACGGGEPESTGGGDTLQGTVAVDGSSTVFPVTEAVAEEFGAVEPRVRVTVGVSGTGGGFKKFTIAETDINDASRPIKETEQALAQENGVEFIELPIAYDGLSVVVHKDNDWVDQFSVEELKRIWQPGSTVRTWKDVRPEWPDEEIVLYAPGTDSGTFDYFTEAINGDGGACRTDFTASEDDNVIVQGVAGDVHALGFFGFAYYEENQDRLRVVPIDGGAGPVEPTVASINDGTYSPLSRPIFIYVSKSSAERPEVARFVEFYLDNAAQLAAEVGYVALPDEVYAAAEARFAQRVAGTVFDGESEGVSLAELFQP